MSELKIDCIHGYTECENWPNCLDTEGCFELIDELESRARRDSCPLAGGIDCCEDCRECQRW